jgi:hypothetical protein
MEMQILSRNITKRIDIFDLKPTVLGSTKITISIAATIQKLVPNPTDTFSNCNRRPTANEIAKILPS